ncbi:MAG: hypothetical protein NTX86_04130 [Candidatus Dependentiae bacterium]|nr:hypothetical protein [Candidatus Dependentiae bacterium]
MYKKVSIGLVFLVSFSMINAGTDATYDVYGFYTDFKKVMEELCPPAIAAQISDEERSRVAETGGSPVYGEIIFDSITALLADIKLTADDVFYDIGSGLGKFVLQVYLMTPAKKSIGVEYSKSRCETSQKLKSRGEKIYNESFKFENGIRKVFGKPQLAKTKKKTFEYRNEDALEADFSDATVAFTCSTCFGPEFMQKLTDKLSDNDGLRILSLKELPYNEDVHYVKTHMLPMTWVKNSPIPVYMYEVDHSKKAVRSDAKAEEKPVVAVKTETKSESKPVAAKQVAKNATAVKKS